MQRQIRLDKSEKWAYFISWCVVGGLSFLLGTAHGLRKFLKNIQQARYYKTDKKFQDQFILIRSIFINKLFHHMFQCVNTNQ
jgi:hypothetical protein